MMLPLCHDPTAARLNITASTVTALFVINAMAVKLISRGTATNAPSATTLTSVPAAKPALQTHITELTP
jgi:hypothetical protein